MSDGEGYIWFWYGDDGEWKIFTDEQQDKIERARIQGEDLVMLHRGPTTYSLDLVQKFQTNVDTSHQRPISAARANTVWFWKDDDGQTWNCYDLDDARKLSTAEAGREDSVILMIGQTPYYVDLARRTQKNVLTEFIRDICQGKPPKQQATAAADDEEEEDEELVKAAPESFLCPVSLKLMRDPVTNSVGSTYDRKAIEWWWQKHDTDPLTMETISDKYLVPNRALKDAIEQWKNDFIGGKKPAALQVGSLASIDTHTQSTTARAARGLRQSSGGYLRTQTPSTMLSTVQRSISAPSAASESSVIAAGNVSAQPGLDRASIETAEIEGQVELREGFYNTLKIVFLGNNKMGTSSIARKLVYGRNAVIESSSDGVVPPGVDILQWDPQNIDSHDDYAFRGASDRLVKFNVWDFVGRDTFTRFRSMFFSPKALFIVVWDMGVSNPAVMRQSEFDAVADEALEHDIYQKVLLWVDYIQNRVPDAVIMPVASFSDYFNNDKKSAAAGDMGDNEARRRCKVLRSKLLLQKRRNGQSTFIFGDGDDPIMRVSGYSATGLDVLREKILSVGKDAALFGRIGSPIPPKHLKLWDALRSLKEKGCKGVEVARLNDIFLADGREVLLALDWLSSAGELLYFGSAHDLQQLSQSVILDINWFTKMAGCMLRHNLDVVIRDTRRLNRKNSKGASPDLDTSFFDGAYLICPLISSGDVHMLWQRAEAQFDQHSPPTYEGLSTLKLYKFLQTLLIHFGVMVPIHDNSGPYSFNNICALDSSARKYMIDVSRANGSTHMFLLPGLLEEGDHGEDLDFYKNADVSIVTLTQAVHFFSRVPTGLMERVTIAVLRQINALHNRQGAQEIDMTLKAFQCWRSIFFLKMRTATSDSNEEATKSIVEICVQLVDRRSRRCIGSDHVDDRIKACLVISAQGPAADCGISIWNGGYGLVAETARAVVQAYRNVHFETRSFCTECLARNDLSKTQSWTSEKIKNAVKKCEGKLRCENGHKVDTRLLAGTRGVSGPVATAPVTSGHVPDAKAAAMLKQSVVLVGLYDARKRTNKICKLGSGFVVDSERGLILTASRNVMNITGEEKFGVNYYGIEGAKIVIGVIPDKREKEPLAVFRYYASIVAKDPAIEDGFCHVDACLLELTAKFEYDVDGNGDACSEEINIPLRGKVELMKQQSLKQLDLTDGAKLEEPVRILGFEQKDDSDVQRCLGIVAGYVCQQKGDSTDDQESDKYQHRPKRMTVLMCPAKHGLIGGPCINKDGKVVGILSCADPHEKTRCFVTPSSEWKPLLPAQDSPTPRKASSWIGSVLRSISSPSP